MPVIAEPKEIDGQLWARIPMTGDEGRIQILSDAEMAANDANMQKMFSEIDRLQAEVDRLERSAGED